MRIPAERSILTREKIRNFEDFKSGVSKRCIFKIPQVGIWRDRKEFWFVKIV